jgi:Arginine methyltransferase oligomerization subdomain/Ribosomal protein L11 methyltransferase (PrmA)
VVRERNFLSLIVDEHRQYLADMERLSAFREAINAIVKPGHLVLDLGAGTGILGLLACNAGASRVYSIEEGGMIELARSVCCANGFQDRVTFIKGFSLHLDLPEKVDVVIGDQIGRFGFDAGVLEYFSDARERFLKPDGVMIPSRIDLCVVPVECPEIWNQVEFWNTNPAGFDFSPTRSWAANTGYPVKYRVEQLLGEPAVGTSIDLKTVSSAPLNLEGSILVAREGILHGIGGWFSAQLSADVILSNSPLATKRINRMNVFFPIDEPVAVVGGDWVRIKIHIMPADFVVTWNVEVWGKNQGDHDVIKGKFTHSTWKGMLLCKEDLNRTRPDFIPILTERGEARLFVLKLCNGERRLSEIEGELYRCYPKLFRSRNEAATFVAEVVTRYSK